MDERRGAMGLAATLVAALCACGPVEREDGDGIEFRSDDGSVPAPSGRPGGGGWISNGLQSPNVSGIDPAHGLDTSQGMADDAGLLTDPSRMGTAEYLVECALPLGESITKTVEGQTVELHGLLGLAPEWASDECDEECQQWVTACMLARTNVSGEPVLVWFASNHPAIGDEVPEGLIHEAGWFGNLFASPDEQYLCKGAPSGPAAAMRDGRTCVQGQACGFTKYPHCDHGRCTLAGPTGELPIDCVPNGPGATAYATISTYVPD
jgi:hypothetical protein